MEETKPEALAAAVESRLAPRNGSRPTVGPVPVAGRMLATRRRRSVATWIPFNVRRCSAYVDGTCPYRTSPDACGHWRRWNTTDKTIVPVCGEEKQALLGLAASFTSAGLSGPVSMVLAGALLKAGRDGDGRLNGEVLRQLGQLELERLRGAMRALAKDGDGDGLGMRAAALLTTPAAREPCTCASAVRARGEVQAMPAALAPDPADSPSDPIASVAEGATP